MKKEFFRNLARNLANSYSIDELAKLLVKNKDRRISNLIAAAYNMKVQGAEKIPQTEVVEFDFYDYMEKVFGPDSWLYNYIDKSRWDSFKAMIDKQPDQKSKEDAIYFAYKGWQNSIEAENASKMRYFRYIDKKIEAEKKLREEEEKRTKIEKKDERGRNDSSF